MKKLLTAALAALCLTAPAANAQLEYKQVGTIKANDYQYRTSNLPVYTMSKYAQGVTIYRKDFLSMNANTLIKELTFFGYQDAKSGTVQYSLYIGNTTSTSIDDFIIPGENEGSAATTLFDMTKVTKFADVTFTSIAALGSSAEPVEILSFTNDTGFEYTGENLIVFITMNDGLSTCVAPYTTFMTANNGTAGNSYGGYRETGYTTVGYGINTKKWTKYTGSTNPRTPVVKIGYAGARVAVEARVSGKMVSSLNNNGISGATVSLGGQTATTDTSGSFSFTIDDVDMDATYTLTASATGYEDFSQVVDIRSGGDLLLGNFVMTKLPVPATLSGRVLDSADSEAIPGATVAFNGQSVTTDATGNYSFSVANIDVLPAEGLALTANAAGFIPYNSNVQLTGNMDMDIRLEPLGQLPGEGTLVGEFNPDNYSFAVPFNPLWNYSNQQFVYPATMLSGLAQGSKISSVSFYGYYPEPAPAGGGDEGGEEGDDDYGYGYAPAKAPAQSNYNLKLYITDADFTQFGSPITPISTEALTPYFDGQVTLNTSGDLYHPVELVKLEFDRPYEYTGGNVAMIANVAGGRSALLYFCTVPSAGNGAIVRISSTEVSLETTNWGNVGVLPVLRLGQYVQGAVISGTVTDETTHAPVENVTVTVTGNGATGLSTTTDAQGRYSISIPDYVLDSRYRVNFSCDGYDDETANVTFTEGNLEQTLNITMYNPESGIEGIGAEGALFDVYTVTGVKVLNGADASRLGTLPAGIYIANGKKIIIK